MKSVPVLIALALASAACGSTAESGVDDTLDSATQAPATGEAPDAGSSDDGGTDLCAAMEALVDIDPLAQSTPENVALIERVADLAPPGIEKEFELLLAFQKVLVDGPLEEKYDEILALSEEAGDTFDEGAFAPLTAECGLFVPVLGDEIEIDETDGGDLDGDGSDAADDRLIDRLYALFPDGTFIVATVAGGRVDLAFRDAPADVDVTEACVTIVDYFATEGIDFQRLRLTDQQDNELAAAGRDGTCVLAGAS